MFQSDFGGFGVQIPVDAGGTVTNVTGVADRITVTNGTTTPLIDISATFEALLGKVASPLSQFAATTSAQLLGVISDPTGTGSLVFSNAPTLVTPVLGVATATSINKVILTAPATSATLTLADGTTTAVTGGGTIALGGFTLTVPATGTAALLGTANVFTANQAITLSQNAITSLTVTNSNGGGGANAGILSSNGTWGIYQQMLGTGYTTSGLLVANQGLINNTGSTGTLYLNSNASTTTYHKWAIGGTAAGNQIMNLLTTGLSLTPTTLTDGTNALSVTATMPSVITAVRSAVEYNITSAGSSSQGNRALLVNYLAGYTGSSTTAASVFSNVAAGTGGNLSTGVGNFGINGFSTATTTGYNIGGRYAVSGGNLSIGVLGQSITLKNSATNGGGVFFGNNTGTSPIHFGVYAGLNTTDPTFASAALIADNASTTDPIALFRDNGAVVISHIDGGLSFFGGSTTPTAIVHIGASTTARASLNIVSGTAPTSPNDGDIWNDGSDLKVRLGGVTYTLTKS